MINFINKQVAIDEIEYEIEMINSALDSLTLDFNARERLYQRRGEAKEILNSIQQLPSVQPEGWMERNKERILQAGREGREIEFRIGGRLFAIREKAQ